MRTGTYDPGEVRSIVKGDKKGNGIEAALIGEQGCGKTNGLVQICLERMGNGVNDVIIWRGMEDCQWSYFLNYDVDLKFWIKEGLDYELIDRENEEKTELKKYGEIERWKNARNLVDKLNNDYINVIQTTPHSTNKEVTIQFCRDWKNLFEEFSRRMWKRGITVSYDELRDLAKPGRSGQFWNLMFSLGSALRKGRKNNISYFFSIHNKGDIFWDIRNKIRYKIYMKGATKESTSEIRKNLSTLDDGEAVVEGTSFEPFHFYYDGDEKLLRARINVGNIGGGGS